MNIVTIIQARISSTRLPGKVLLPVLGEPLLIKMVERVRSVKLTGQIVIATSTNNEDDKIEELCSENNLIYFRGDLTDLLDRHYQAGKNFGADAVVKIPSDCPLIDPQIIDRVLKYYIDNSDKFDFVSNLHPASYPDGNDVEIMSFSALEKAWKESTKELEREHTTPYFWEKGLDYSTSHRWTIDFEEDYLFIKKVYEELYKNNPAFGLYDILNLLGQKPEIAEINQKHTGKYWYENHLEELTHIDEYKNKISKK